MIGFVFLIVATLLVCLMFVLFLFISVTTFPETRSKAPLERGFSTTGRIFKAFSLQFLVILVLFLVFDLEVVFVVALVFRGGAGSIRRVFLVGLIVARL